MSLKFKSGLPIEVKKRKNHNVGFTKLAVNIYIVITITVPI